MTVRLPRRPVKPSPVGQLGSSPSGPNRFTARVRGEFFHNRIAVTATWRVGRRRGVPALVRARSRGGPLSQSCLRSSAVSSRLLSGEVQVRLLPEAPSLRVRGANGRAQRPLKPLVESSNLSAPTICDRRSVADGWAPIPAARVRFSPVAPSRGHGRAAEASGFQPEKPGSTPGARSISLGSRPEAGPRPLKPPTSVRIAPHQPQHRSRPTGRHLALTQGMAGSNPSSGSTSPA